MNTFILVQYFDPIFRSNILVQYFGLIFRSNISIQYAGVCWFKDEKRWNFFEYWSIVKLIHSKNTHQLTY